MFKGGFFDAQVLPSGEFDRQYNSDDFSQCFSCFMADGVVGKNKETSDSFQIIIREPESKKIIIKPGIAWIGGRWCVQDAEQEFEISMPTQVGKKRIDAIFIRCDYDVREFSFVVKNSEEFDINTLPEDYPIIITQNDRHAKELLLGEIEVTYMSTSIDECLIVDKRTFAQTRLNDWALGGLSIVKCTQEEYDAMQEHFEDTMYVIIGSE